MLLILAIILALLWIGGFTIFHVSSALIHLLILAAIVAVIAHFVTYRSRRTV